MSLVEGKSRWPFVLIVGLFALVFGSITFVNHYLFRTYALDLGMFNQALYCFSHFQNSTYTLGISDYEANFFATHFSPIIFLFTPFYYLFGSYAMLVVQWLAILFGGIGIYRLASVSFIGKYQYLPELVLVYFYSIWGIYSALSFDFHHNVIAAMLVPWFIYFFVCKKYYSASLFLVLVLFCQENMALWAAFILLGLMLRAWWQKTLDKRTMAWLSGWFVFASVYFVVIVECAMPALQHADGNLQFGRYSHLGNSLGDILGNLIGNPRMIFSLLFENHLGEPAYNGIKSEMHFMVMVSGGLLMFYRPYVLLMLLPIYAQKLFSNDMVFWGINVQYSIEFVPLLSFVLIDFVKGLEKKKATWVTGIFVLLALGASMAVNASRKSLWYSGTNTQFYSSTHYQSPLHISSIYEGLKLIPADIPISASTALVPHLANRKRIYGFPIVKDAAYIVLLKQNASTYPIGQEDFEKEVAKYRNNKTFEVFYEKDELLIFRKK